MRVTLLAGLLAGSFLMLSACATNDSYVPTASDLRTKEQRAEACLERFTPSDRAPQIMTYDSQSGTEVHMNTDGPRVDVTGRNVEDKSAMGMGGRVGGSLPQVCTDEYPGGMTHSLPAPDRRRGWP